MDRTAEYEQRKANVNSKSCRYCPIGRSSFTLSDWRSQQEGSDGLADWADVLEHISEKVRQT